MVTLCAGQDVRIQSLIVSSPRSVLKKTGGQIPALQMNQLYDNEGERYDQSDTIGLRNVMSLAG